MPIIEQDSNGNIIIPESPSFSPDSLVMDKDGNFINPAKEDGNLQILSNQVVTNLNLKLTDLLNGIKGLDNKDISTLQNKIEDTLTLLQGKLNMSISDLAASLEEIQVNVETLIGIKDLTGTQINPATLESIQSLNTLLSDIKTILNSLDTKTTIINTNDVKITSSVLPTGAATESTLSSINTKIPADPAREDGNLSSIATNATSINSKIDSVAKDSTLSSLNNKIDTTQNGIKVDGSGVIQPISANSLPLPTNAAKETGGNLDSIKSNTDKIDVPLSTRATETTLQGVNTNLVALGPKLDNIKTQLDTRVRGLFDANGNPVDLILIPITGNRGISSLSATIDQYYAFNKQMFCYGYSVNVNGNDTNVMALLNPTGSGKIILIKHICIARNQDNTNGVFFYIRSGATITTGTSVTPLSTISGGTSIVTLYTAPTATTTGNLLFVMGLNSNESSRQEDFNFIFGLNPGENLLIVGNATANGTPCFVTLNWVEV